MEKKERGVAERGAEAVVYMDAEHVIKVRERKEYRIDKIDIRIRRSRTKAEKMILKRLAPLNISPKVIDKSEDDEYTIRMERIDGETLFSRRNMDVFEGEVEKVSGVLARMHEKGVVHGDLTLNNIIVQKESIYLIDFGLGQVTQKEREKAIDIYLFERAIRAACGRDMSAAIEKGYFEIGKGSSKVMERLREVRKSGRKREESSFG